MTPRPLLLPVAALLATLALASCNASPEAGHPNTAPTTAPTATPTPTGPSTPTYTEQEQAAITAAKARYATARKAVAKALADPPKAQRSDLEKAGNGGTWLGGIVEEIDFQRQRGWYQPGAAKLLSLTASSVKLQLAQPEVLLTGCLDGTGVVYRYQATGKPVPVGPSNGPRHTVQARLVFAPGATGTKMWFLVDEKASTKC